MDKIKSNIYIQNKNIVHWAVFLVFLAIVSVIWAKSFAEDIPNAPSDLSYGTVTSSLIPLTWTDNATNEDKFNIERKLSTDSSYSFLAQITGSNITSYDDTSITQGSTYDYRVQACLSGTGCSDYVTLSGVLVPPVVTVPTPTIPNAPSSLSFTNPAVARINLTWTDNATNEDKFNIERKLSSATAWTSLSQITVADTTSYNDTSVTVGSTYDYRVQACLSGTGCSEYSTLSNVFIPSSIGGGTTCSALTLTFANGKTSYTLGESVNYTWTCYPGGTASNVSMWLVKPDNTSVLYNSGSGSGTQTMGFSTSNLVPGSYILKACFSPTCATGTIMATQTFTITTTGGGNTIPSAPTNLSINGTTTSATVPLRWNDNSTNENSFKIERKLSTGTTYNYIGQVGTNITNYTDTTVAAGVTYDYRVQACLLNVGCSSYVTLSGVAVTSSATNPVTTGGSGSGSCSTLNLTFANGKTSYTLGESVNYTWTCYPGGTASNVSMWLTKPDNTSVLYNSGSGSGTQSMGFSTSNLVPGSYILKACFNPTCATGTIMATQPFTVTTTTIIPPVNNTTSIPLAPSNLSYKIPSITSGVYLTWTDNATNEDKFNIERKLSSATTWTFVKQISGSNVISYNDNSVTVGSTYDYRVQACLSGTGCSPYATLPGVVISNATTVVKAPVAPTAPVIPTITPTTPLLLPETTTKVDTAVNTTTILPVTTTTSESEKTVTIPSPVVEITQKDITEIINTISGVEVNTPASNIEDKKEPEVLKEITELVYKDTNKDGISDYDSKYIYNIDPVKSSVTSSFEGKKINAGDKILLGFDPTKTELVKVEKEQPLESQATVVNSYKVKEIALTEKKEIVFKGQALPNSFVTVYIYSTPIIVTIKTDSKGEWQYSFDKELENGDHTVYVATVNNTGNIMAKSSPYSFTKTAEAVTLQDLPVGQASVVEIKEPGLMQGKNLYVIIASLIFVIGATLILIGLFSKKNNQESNQA